MVKREHPIYRGGSESAYRKKCKEIDRANVKRRSRQRMEKARSERMQPAGFDAKEHLILDGPTEGENRAADRPKSIRNPR